MSFLLFPLAKRWEGERRRLGNLYFLEHHKSGDLPSSLERKLCFLTSHGGCRHMTIITNTKTISISQTSLAQASLSQKLIAGSLALFIGLSLIYGTGIIQNMAVHNGAHDMRHASGFPCH